MSTGPLHSNACGHTFSAHLDKCPRCKAAKVDKRYAIEGEPVGKATDAEKAYAKRQRAIQAKIKPGTEKQLFTSTMPEDKE
jgi:DNA-binding helix-hairpin-helix protein with protein kinase domain